MYIMTGPRFESEFDKEFVLYATCVERTYTSWPRLSIARGGKKNVCLLPLQSTLFGVRKSLRITDRIRPICPLPSIQPATGK